MLYQKFMHVYICQKTQTFENNIGITYHVFRAFWVVQGKNLLANARDVGQIPGWEDPLEEEMAPYSNALAWKIPWAEEPGGLQYMGSLRVRHDGMTEHTHTNTHTYTIQQENLP